MWLSYVFRDGFIEIKKNRQTNTRPKKPTVDQPRNCPLWYIKEQSIACLSSSKPMIGFCFRVISFVSLPQPFRGATYLREFWKPQNLYFKLGKLTSIDHVPYFNIVYIKREYKMSNMVNFVETLRYSCLLHQYSLRKMRFFEWCCASCKQVRQIDVNWPCPIFEYCVDKERIQNVEHGQFCRTLQNLRICISS